MKSFKVTTDLKNDLKQYEGLRVAVPWSAGLDSTLLVCALLEAGAYVQAIGCCFNRSPAQYIQMKCRRAMGEAIAEKWDKFAHHEVNLMQETVTQSYRGCMFDGRTLSQPAIWTSLMDMYAHGNTDVVAMGYVMGDDALSFLDEIRKSWNGRQMLKEKCPAIVFPLMKIHKVEVSSHVENLPSNISKWIYTCEQVHYISNVSNLSPNFGSVDNKCHTCKKEMFYSKIKRNDPFNPNGGVKELFKSLDEHRQFFKELEPRYIPVVYKTERGSYRLAIVADSKTYYGVSQVILDVSNSDTNVPSPLGSFWNDIVDIQEIDNLPAMEQLKLYQRAKESIRTYCPKADLENVTTIIDHYRSIADEEEKCQAEQKAELEKQSLQQQEVSQDQIQAPQEVLTSEPEEKPAMLLK